MENVFRCSDGDGELVEAHILPLADPVQFQDHIVPKTLPDETPADLSDPSCSWHWDTCNQHWLEWVKIKDSGSWVP